ncbi:MAG: hypothetical protein ACXVGH_13290 [Mycobacteriales bacterium]
MTTVQVSAQGATDVLHSGGMSDPQTEPSRLQGLTSRVTRPVSALRQVPGIATYAGLALALAGGVLLLVAWGKTAGLTNVALQVPYLVSAGCTGLALVAVGLTVVSLAAKSADARARRAQLLELQHVLAEIRKGLEEQR